MLAGLSGAPSPAQQQAALVEGFQLAFIVSAALIAVGAVLVAVLLRRRDVARIESGAAGDAVPVPT